MVLYSVRNICQRYRRGREGNTKEENSGYVVFKGNILVKAGKKRSGEGKRRYSALPHPFLRQVYGYKFKGDVNSFSSSMAIFSNMQHKNIFEKNNYIHPHISRSPSSTIIPCNTL
jgi:hypothetical protein